MNFVALDFETANSKRTSVCQIGIAVFENGNLAHSESLLVKPEPNYFMPINMSIHGIYPEDVVDKPNFAEYWPNIKHYFENKHIVAHNAAFDLSVLRQTLKSFDIPLPNLKYYCSLLIARKMLPGRYSYSLPHICGEFGIRFDHHDAAADAIAAGKLAVEILRKFNFSSLEELSVKMNFKIGEFKNNLYTAFSSKNAYDVNFLNN